MKREKILSSLSFLLFWFCILFAVPLVGDYFAILIYASSGILNERNHFSFTPVNSPKMDFFDPALFKRTLEKNVNNS